MTALQRAGKLAHACMCLRGTKCLFILLFTFLHIHHSFASDAIKVTAPLEGAKGQIKIGAEAEVKDEIFLQDLNASPRTIRSASIQNIISFKLNESSLQFLKGPFHAELRYKLIYTDSTGKTDSLPGDQSLKINFDTAANVTYLSKASFDFKNAVIVRIRVISITHDAQQFDPTASLVVTNEILYTHTYNFDCVKNTSIINYQVPGNNYDALRVFWTAVKEADEFDLEWTYIDKTAITNNVYGTQGTYPFYQSIFRRNSTRVTVNDVSEYMVPTIYDNAGILFFRVRSVQHEGNRRVESKWSDVRDFECVPHEASLNWQSQISFAEEGKRKVVVNYADGTLRNRQTVTKDNTTDKTIVAETYYDHQGRPTIQVLPAPTMQSLLGFTPSFATINGKAYNKTDYDILINNNCDIGAPAMSNTTGAANYYSTSNPLKGAGFDAFIPESNGFPFTETQYTNDNTGRIAKQGGVGAQHQIGTGHETKYYYGNPDQNELDALFGTEAGNASHYFKNMVRDANGQYSVSYTDMHGRTIATALAGDLPQAMKLNYLPSKNDATLTKTLLDEDNNIKKDLSVESVKGLIVTKAGNNVFIYSFAPNKLSVNDCNNVPVCYSCLYDLEITITDDCGNQKLGGQPFVFKKSNFSLLTLQAECSDQLDPFNVQFTKYLDEGSYTVTKKLTISEQALKYYKDTLFVEKSVCKSLTDFINEQKQFFLANTNCKVDCSDCKTKLGTYQQFLTKYVNENALDINNLSSEKQTEILKTYNSLLEECDLLCTKPNQTGKSDIVLQQMKADLTPPSGQYANPDDQQGAGIFVYGNNEWYGWWFWDYKDENGNPDFVTINGQKVRPNDLTQQQFIDNFKPSWLNTLLPLHPEYCKQQLLADEFAGLGKKNEEWDADFGNTETYAEAYAKGYLNPTGNSNYPYPINTANIDPYTNIKMNGGQGRKGLLEGRLEYFTKDANYNFTNLWAAATIAGACHDPLTNACIAQFKANPFDKNICTGDLDMAWRVFRAAYLSFKQKMIQDDLNALSCSAPSGYVSVLPDYSADVTSKQNIPSAFDASDVNQVKQNVAAAQQNIYTQNCSENADLWWNQLAPCTKEKLVNYKSSIISHLINICVKGSDETHPFGSASIAPNQTYTFKSFDAVIQYYVKQYNANNNDKIDPAVCNGTLITTPLPYNASVPAGELPVWKKPDTCTCNKINSLYTEYLAAKKDASFSDFMKRTENTFMSNAVLDSLRDMCSDKIPCNYLQAPIMLPPSLQCGTPPACINCAAFKNIQSEFKAAFPTVTVGTGQSESNNMLFEKFANQHLGFSKTYSEYFVFADSCAGQRGDSTIYIPPVSVDREDTLVFSTSGITKPNNITCAALITTYKNFIADFPDPSKGATVGVLKNTNGFKTNSITYAVIDEKAIMQQSQSGNDSVPMLQINSASLRANPVNEFAPSAVYADSTMNCIGLFEWYFNQHLAANVNYTYQNYMDWLVNDCKYAVRQLPCDAKMYVTCDTLQNVLNAFNQLYSPDSSNISEILKVPVQKVTHIRAFYNNDGSLKSEQSNTSFAALGAGTWTDGGWFNMRDHVSFNFKVLPANAVITLAQMYLGSKPEHIEFFPCCGAHYADNADDVYGTMKQLTAMPIPGKTTWTNQPPVTNGAAVVLPTLDAGYSNYNYLSGCTQTAIDLHAAAYANKNYGLLFMLSDEAIGSYKAMSFWGITNQTPQGKEPGLFVWYSAPRCDVFAAYVNNKLGSHLSTQEVLQLYKQHCNTNITGCAVTGSSNDTNYTAPHSGFLLCNESSYLKPVTLKEEKPCDDADGYAETHGTALYNDYIKDLKSDFADKYINQCLQNTANESFTVTQPVSEYHYTLYYYDQAGNLVKTVPPAGVKADYSGNFLQQVKTARAANQIAVPQHELVTDYRYNSLNAVVSQKTPDAGTSNFWYDRLGRLAVSQNAKQKISNGFSYTKYDALGRITETGFMYAGQMTDAISKSPQDLKNWLTWNAGGRMQITNTYYDASPKDLKPLFEENKSTLRNRVAVASYTEGNDPKQYTNATYYNYDIHGNVDTLFHDLGANNIMDQTGNRYKKIVYKYDLISGKVNHVAYQPNKIDALYHKYAYDAENRLTDVYTSRDSVTWEREAAYAYYKHGPLARLLLGENQVQGIDYAYTLQGWLKGVNSSELDVNADMGSDGNTNVQSRKYVGKDVYSYVLNYFKDDYKAINANQFADHTTALQNSNAYRPLYNGNINSMLVNIGAFNQPMLYNYTYDQLNRLNAMDAFKINNNTLVSTNAYKEKISYDANGNIQSYDRNGTEAKLNMDKMQYNYITGTNKLNYVADNAGDNNGYTEDVKTQYSGNYDYDAIGNMVRDNSAQIWFIDWNVYGKIKEIQKNKTQGAPFTNIKYGYDAAGNRISKIMQGDSTITEWYVRDAQGNIMTVYRHNNWKGNDVMITEQPMYGSSRLGIIKPYKKTSEQFVTVNMGNIGSGTFVNFERNRKQYEMSNHLGSVMVTLCDKKIGVDNNNDGVIDYYTTDVQTAQHYSSFGATLSGMEYNSVNQTHGFNGQQKANEVASDHYTAQYWEYDARLGRRWNLDPVNKPWQSDYSVLSNSPIWKVDPNGADDFFNADGKFLYRTKEGTLIRVVTKDGTKLFSEIAPNNNSNIKTLVNIVAHYAPQAGIPAGTRVGISPKTSHDEKDGKSSLAFTSDGIYVSAKGGVDAVLNDYNNFVNTLHHEENHRKNDDSKNDKYKFSDHVGVYEAQINDKSFAKTDNKYKIGIAGSYASYLLGALNTEEINDDQFKKKIADMNSTLKKYGVYIKTEYSSAELPAVSVYGKDNNGASTKSSKYIEPKTNAH